LKKYGYFLSGRCLIQVENEILHKIIDIGKDSAMLRKKFIQIIIVGAIVSLLVGNANGSTAVIRKCRDSYLIAKPLGHKTCVTHKHRGQIVITSPLFKRFIRIYSPRPKIVVVERPCVRHIAVNLSPTITVTRPKCTVEQTEATVWITNSNGSRTSVKLKKSGPGYLGPRGEWYPNMPTNEQLRMVYGF
jgi:hypothetical protein